MTRPEKVLAGLVVLAGFVFQAMRHGAPVEHLRDVAIAGAFSVLWAVCLFGCWLAYKAARALHLEDIKEYEQYEPVLHYVGPAPLRKRPTPWKAAIAALALGILLMALVVLSAKYVPSIPDASKTFNLVSSHTPTAEEIARELSKLRGTVWALPKRESGSTPTKASGAPAPVVRVIFKDGFTFDARSTVQQSIDAYYSFLVNLGLNPPIDLPPIGLVPGSHQFWNATFDSLSAVNGGMSIGSGSIPDDAVMAYGIWTFNKLSGFNSNLYAWTIPLSYFGCVFLHKNTVTSWIPEKRWTPALLEVRRQCGGYFTDKSVAMAFQGSGKQVPLAQAFDLIAGYRSDKPVCALEILKHYGL